jgi:hypothetical protein
MTYELPKIGTEGWRVHYLGHNGDKVYISKETIGCIHIDKSGIYFLFAAMSSKNDRIYLTKEEALKVMKDYVEWLTKECNIKFIANPEDNSYTIIN